jgi:FkbM family methyltransferase
LESFEHLQRNVTKRGLRNVLTSRVALWSSDMPEIRLWSVEEIGYTSVCQYYSSTGSETVPAIRLDGLGLKPAFIKIDCELAEYEILRGSEQTLKRGVDCVVLEFNYHLMVQNKMSDHLIRDYMADLGYEMFLIGIEDGRGAFVDPILIDRKRHIQVQGDLTYMNVMFSNQEKVRELWEKKAN